MREMRVVFGGEVGGVVVVVGSGDSDDSEDVEGVFFGGWGCCSFFPFSCSPSSVSVRRSRIVFIS